MRKTYLFILTLLFTVVFTCKDVSAYDSSTYRNRSLCGTFELASFHSDGNVQQVGCYGTFVEAQKAMRENGANDLGILAIIGGVPKILDANQAIVDLTVNGDELTYYYLEASLNSRRYTYMYNKASYGGVDAGFVGATFSNDSHIFMAEVEIADFSGWIPQYAYEIIPITWVKSYSSYTVNDESIIHNNILSVKENPRYYSVALGPKPEMLNNGTYYSYDGHYFYDSIEKLMIDYKNHTRSNSVNSTNPYYNYYMYLSNHTRTNYSSINIDEYIRNNLGYTMNVYGKSAANGTSRLYGSGNFFYYAQEKYGVNAVLSLSLSRNETGNGRSYLSIIKNNGFGLNAVDSNPINGANSYGSFPSSILGYASKWITYGYAHPNDWRYFGPQFGNKWIGMNVSYASDTYWSEKMANNYYNLDRAFGLQDYNYYQLGVVNGRCDAYASPNTSSRIIYDYPEAEDAVVIVGEVTVNNEKWYKVVSDLNIDANYNEITSGNYNWNGYVYVKASNVKLINKAKSGYKSPNDVTPYQNKNYEYDLYVVGGVLQPKVGVSTKATAYHYDSSLTSKTGKTLLKDRYVMVYSVAMLNNQPVAYLVTSDYWYDQKEWVSADSIRLTDMAYGKVTLNYDENLYSTVSNTRIDESYTYISGLYHNSYVPILESSKVGNDTWYKVPVSLVDNNNIYGYTLAQYGNMIHVELSKSVVTNTPPVITASDVTLIEGDTFDPLKNVKASDTEDGDLTSKITIKANNVDTKTPGTYSVTYEVKDKENLVGNKTIKVIVKLNNNPVVTANDKEIIINTSFNPLSDVSAKDEEDGDLTSKIEVTTNTVNNKVVGVYKVVYQVKDSRGKIGTKEIKVEVVKDQKPVINATNKTIALNDQFDPYKDVTATDAEDGDITNKIKVISNNVNTTKVGTYQVKYQVVDTSLNTVEKTITVIVKDSTSVQGEFYLDNLSWNKNTKKFSFSGYLIFLNEDNSATKKYELIVQDKVTASKYTFEVPSWTTSVPFDLGSENGKSYANSWFKGEVDLSSLPNGDYDLFMKASSSSFYAEEELSNIFNKDITRRAETDKKGFEFRVLLDLRAKKIELKVRNELISTSVPPTFRNMINDYDNIEFVDGKLLLVGTSYDYNGTYSDSSKITRKVIFENQNTFEQISFDIGSTNKGSYLVKSKDNKSKEYAWYNKEVDISSLPKGTYTIIIYTKTIDAEDYGNVSDMFGNIPEPSTTINGKKYSIKLNKDVQNRVELIVQ